MENVPEQFRTRGYTQPYNRWHWDKLKEKRNQKGQGLLMLDLDSIEVRGKKIVAIIELRSTDTPLNDWQKSIVLQIADSLNVPCFLTFHSENMKAFKVTNQKTNECKFMNEEEYIKFLEEL